MRIAVFGSTGTLGIEVVKQALDLGYNVVAFARNKEKLLHFKNEKLEIIQSDLSNSSEIECAVTSVDAVVSVLGPNGNVKNTELSDGIQSIINSMTKVGTKRFISLSTASLVSKSDRLDLKYKLLVSMIKLTVNGAYKEIVKMGNLTQSSSLDWTLVRVGFLNNGEVQPVKVGHYGHGLINVKISRSSIARFMLNQIESNEYVRRMPAISN
jgi:putative NADH-flavin reductase